MDKTKTVKTRKTPTPAFAVISFLVIVAVLVALINLGVDTTMSVFIAALIAVVIALLLDIPWADVERTLLRVVSDCIPTFLIVIMVGMLVGIWMAGGTVPALMYYGMKLISPKILVPLAFVLSGLTAEFTGTSFGSVATMGIALVGVASTTSIPVPLVIAAVVCGAWFGDKMSPLSDTTNLASGVSRVPLYDHIGSMMYTTIPAALVALVLFTAAGLMHSGGEMDTTRANLICDTLAEHFNLNPILILPAILVLLVSVFKLPALLGMGLTVVVSIVFAMVFQGVNFVELMNYAANGFTLSTGVDIVDPMLNRGGITSMTGLLITFMVASLMHSGGEMDTTRANLICDTLAEHFNLNPILILPAILVLLVSVFKLPALLGMGLTVVVSIVFAMVFQGVNFVELMNYAANGFTLSTGVDIVDPMLNRGGITSMTGLLITFMVASVMGGIITATGILDVLAKDVLLKFIKSRGVLVTVTLIYCYIVNFLTAGGQTVAIIVTEQTFEDAFDRMGIHRRVLSRTLEDAGTLSAPIVPWGVATLYVMEVLGCGTEYIPYCWFIFIVPIFSILCAFSGFGIWDKDGNKMWGRKKAAAK